MKKIISFIIILLFFPLIGSSEAAMDNLLLRDVASQSQLKQALNLRSPSLLGTIIILPTGSFNEPEAEKIITRIDKLPVSILEKMNEQHMKLKLFTGKLTDNPTAIHLTGVVPRGYKNNVTWDAVPGIGGAKTVLVKIGFSEKGNGHSSENLELHELAHSLDRYIFHEISQQQDYLAIWNQEKNSLFPNQEYFLTYAEEYFAESFALYYFNENSRQRLKINAPQTYELIKKLK